MFFRMSANTLFIWLVIPYCHDNFFSILKCTEALFLAEVATRTSDARFAHDLKNDKLYDSTSFTGFDMGYEISL